MAVQNHKGKGSQTLYNSAAEEELTRGVKPAVGTSTRSAEMGNQRNSMKIANEQEQIFGSRNNMEPRFGSSLVCR